MLILRDAGVKEVLRLVNASEHRVVDDLEVALHPPSLLCEVRVLSLESFLQVRDVSLVRVKGCPEYLDVALALRNSAVKCLLELERLRSHLCSRNGNELFAFFARRPLEQRIFFQDSVLVGHHQGVSRVHLLHEALNLGLDVRGLGRHELHQLAAGPCVPVSFVPERELRRQPAALSRRLPLVRLGGDLGLALESPGVDVVPPLLCP